MMHTFTKKTIALLSFMIAMAFATSGSAQIYWDFGTASALSAYPTSGIPANITVDSITKGNSTGTPFLSTTSASNVYAGASAAGNAGVTAKIGALDYTVNASTGSAFYEITLTPAAGYYVSVTGISFGSRSTGTGPRKYSIRSDVDAYATELAGDTINSATSTWGLRTPTLAVNGLSGTALKLRIYGYAGAGSVSAVNFRLDDLTLNATAVAAAATITQDPSNVSSCSGTSATFDVLWSGATSFVWEENAGSGFVALSNGGVYSGADTDVLFISDVTGLAGNTYRCIAMNGVGNDTSNAASLTVNPSVTPNISISGPSSICEADSIVGIATGVNVGANPFYAWSVVGVGVVGTDSVLVIPAGVVPAGTYTVSCDLTSDATCASPTVVTSNTVVLTVNPAPATPIITAAGSTLSTTAPFTTYQWFYGTTALGVAATETATADGIYTVVVTNAFGCSNVSADYNYVSIGIEEQSLSQAISIAPNPSANGIFTITVGAEKTSTLRVYNILGAEVLSKNVTKGTYALDLSAQTNGSYFVRIQNENAVVTKKIIITK